MKARGLKGEIGLIPYSEDLDRYLDLDQCFLEDELGNLITTVQVQEVKLEGQKVFLKFHNYDDRDKVGTLTNLYLAIAREDGVPLSDNTYYIADILGSTAFAEPYGELGQIKDVITSTNQPLLRICKKGEKDIFVPFISQTKGLVDIEKKEVNLILPKGLYEIYRGD